MRKKTKNINIMKKQIIIGIMAGVISGFFASGGGMILVPAFVYLLNMGEQKARATSIMAILPMVIVSSIFYMKSDYINWSVALYCAAGGIIGGIIGAKLLKKLPDKILKIILILFLIYSSVKMIFF